MPAPPSPRVGEVSEPCPNSPGCQHSAYFHEANVLTRQVECNAADNVVDDPHKPYTEQVYTQVPCRCASPLT
jgi:hypothetical protein